MSRLDKKYRHVIKNAENRKRLKIALTVASLAVIFVVFAALTRPGITMTADDAGDGTYAYTIDEDGVISRGGGKLGTFLRGDGTCELGSIRGK